MQLDFVPIEQFYFALTLAVRPLEDIGDVNLVEKVRSRLEFLCGEPSTIAAAKQNPKTDIENQERYFPQRMPRI